MSHEPDGHLGTRAKSKLRQNMLDMRRRGSRRDVQRVGDLSIGQSARDERGDVAFAPGEQPQLNGSLGRDCGPALEYGRAIVLSSERADRTPQTRGAVRLSSTQGDFSESR